MVALARSIVLRLETNDPLMARDAFAACLQLEPAQLAAPAKPSSFSWSTRANKRRSTLRHCS